MDFRVTLDREAFKVLASDTRLDILKALDERPMTVSELGRKLDLNKATVFEHLEKLTGAGLVKKADDEERKWVYYSLSWKARRILHPERVTIALLFSSSLAALLSGVTVAAEYVRMVAPPLPGGGGAGDPRGTLAAPPESGRSGDSAMNEDAVSLKADTPDLAAAAGADPTLLYVAIALFVLVAVLAVIGWYYWRQAKQRDAREAAQGARGASPPPGA